MTKMIKCKKCGHPGHVISITGLQYAQCTHCTNWDPYMFLGINKQCAIDKWNIYNSSGKIVEEKYD